MCSKSMWQAGCGEGTIEQHKVDMYTVWFNTAILSLYAAAVTEESEENGPPVPLTRGRPGNQGVGEVRVHGQ